MTEAERKKRAARFVSKPEDVVFSETPFSKELEKKNPSIAKHAVTFPDGHTEMLTFEEASERAKAFKN